MTHQEHQSADSVHVGERAPGQTAVETITALLDRLIRYHLERAAQPAQPRGADQRDQQLVDELLLAHAALRHAGLDPTQRPPQVAVIGPTQVGKSTIVNMLAGAELAAVSPLAGYTIYPQAFALGHLELPQQWLAALLPGWRRAEAAELAARQGRRDVEADELRCFGLSAVAAPLPSGLPDCLVWDTPDFDSLAARAYRQGVLECAAAADVHLLVVSREKYADLSVWQLLEHLAALRRPLVVVFNKLPPEDRPPLLEAVRQRLRQTAGGYAHAPIVCVDYLRRQGGDELDALAEAWELRDAVATRLKVVHDQPRMPAVARMLADNWERWSAAARQEIAAVDQWRTLVAEGLHDLLEDYRTGFLEHPQRYDTFRRATVELLHLLELPGVGKVMSQVRHTLSWPARKLFAARRQWRSQRLAARTELRDLAGEEVVLFELFERLLTRLEHQAARRADQPAAAADVWRVLAGRLQQQAPRLRSSWQSAARQQRRDFEPQINAAANELYETLRRRPRLLNTLRTARFTAEASSIALSVKMGGLSPADLLLAPAVFGLVSMLTEGSLGTYMSHVAAQLKKKQLEHVRKRLIDGVCAGELHQLAAGLERDGLLGISAGELELARQELANLGAEPAGNEPGDA